MRNPMTIWYFDSDPIGSTPEHVVTTDSPTEALDALCARFGEHLFDRDSELHYLGKFDAGYIIELPADSRCAVIKH